MMKLLKTKLSILTVCSVLILPTAVSAATVADPTEATTPSSPLDAPVAHTIVHGIYVPGIYINFQDSRVAYIPDGVGLVVVDKAIPLPKGSVYLD